MNKTIRMTVFFIFTLLCLGVAGYAFYYLFQPLDPHNQFQLKMARSGWVIPTHFFTSGLALLLVPLQISHRLRQFSVSVHRTIGWLYALAVLLGGVSGLIMSFNASGGWIPGLGFGIMAVLWLVTTTLAIKNAIIKNLTAHKKWIYRSIALTAAAITFRVLLGMGLGVMHLPFMTVYMPAAWLCWIINLMICEVLIQQNRAPFSQVVHS